MTQAPRTSIKAAKRAARHLQDFVRHRRDKWGDLMREAVVQKGHNAHQAAYAVWGLAMWLYNVVGDMFADISIPGAFASGEDFKAKVEEVDQTLASGQAKLRDFVALKQMSPPNLRDVLNEIDDTRSAVVHALHIIAPAPDAAPVQPENAITVVERLAARFPVIAQRLRKRRKPDLPVSMKDEYDVQYIFLALLDAHFSDIRAEEPGRSVAGGASRADCFISDEAMVVEFKRVRSEQTEAKLRTEVADDFVLYGKEERFKHLFVFIYDPERRMNKHIVEKDLSGPRTGFESVRIFVSQ